jgi:hypothetical protein
MPLLPWNAPKVAVLDDAIAREQGHLDRFRKLGRPGAVRQWNGITGRLRSQRARAVEADTALQRDIAAWALSERQKEPVRIHARRSR